MWEQEHIRSTAGPRSPSVSMKTFIYASPALIFDSQRGRRVHNPNYSIHSLYWSLYCTPTVSFHSLTLLGLDVFTKLGKSVSWDHVFTIWPGYSQWQAFSFLDVSFDVFHGQLYLFGKMYVWKDKSSTTSSILRQCLLLSTHTWSDGKSPQTMEISLGQQHRFLHRVQKNQQEGFSFLACQFWLSVMTVVANQF